MSLKINDDLNRFKEIVKGKVRGDLKRLVSSEDLVGQQNGKMVKIPLKNIDLPRFVYGNGGGGAGQGEGEPGDPIDGSGKPQPGKGKAGNEKGDHDLSVEFSIEELAQMLGDELQLPNVDEKGKGKVVSVKNKYTGIRTTGAEGLKHFRRTFKETLKRNISSGTYDPKNPALFPIRSDKRYRTATPIEEPAVNVLVLYIMDVSGSMDDNAKHIAKSETFWIDTWLKSQYKGIESRFIVHDAEASEVDRDQFFSISESGGTSISSAYTFAVELLKDYPFSEYNVYIIQYSDGDNWSDADNNICMNLLQKDLLPNCNLFCYEQIQTGSGSGDYYDNISSLKNDNLITNKIENKDGILNSIKTFLGKGK